MADEKVVKFEEFSLAPEALAMHDGKQCQYQKMTDYMEFLEDTGHLITRPMFQLEPMRRFTVGTVMQISVFATQLTVYYIKDFTVRLVRRLHSSFLSIFQNKI